MNGPGKNPETYDSQELRMLFEKKEVISHTSEEKKLQYIVSQLDKRHSDKVSNYNKDRCNTFGRILLAVNYHDSGLIDRLNGGSLGSVDVQDGTIAFIMGYNESVQGHGIRYLCEYGICHNGKIVSTGPMQYRGAYADETDHRERAYHEIKIIESNDKFIVFGVKSGQQLLLQRMNITRGSFETLHSYNLAEEARIKKQQELEKTLQSNRKENLGKIEELIMTREYQKRNRLMKKNKFITEKFAILPIVEYDRDYDASETAYVLYIVGDDYPEPVVLKERAGSGYNWNRSGKYFTNNIRLSLENIDDTTVLLKVTPHGSCYGPREEQEFRLSLPEKKE